MHLKSAQSTSSRGPKSPCKSHIKKSPDVSPVKLSKEQPAVVSVAPSHGAPLSAMDPNKKIAKRDHKERAHRRRSKPIRSVLMRSLPTELLSEIFGAFCGLHGISDLRDYGGPYGVDSFLRSRLLLLRVCQRWRNIALSTPRLWTSFVLTSRDEYHRNISKRWLQSAASHSMSLSYDADGVSAGLTALDFLVELLPRCDTLQMRLPRIVPGAEAHLMTRMSAPMLTTLTLISKTPHLEFQPEWLTKLLQTTSKLTSLTTDLPVRRFDVLSGQLTHLCLTQMVPLVDVVSYLRTLPMLITLDIEQLGSSGTDEVTPAHVVHKHLQHFISRCWVGSYPHLFACLTLPRLETLDIDPGNPLPLESLKALFQRSECRMKSISLHLDWPERYQFKDDANFKASVDFLVHKLVQLFKLEEVDAHLRQFTVLTDRDFDVPKQVLPVPLLELLAGRSGELPNLVDMQFAASRRERSLVNEILERRVTDSDVDSRLAKLQSFVLHYQKAWRRDLRPAELYYLDEARRRGMALKVNLPKRDDFDLGIIVASDSE